MSILGKFGELFKSTVNLQGYIDTENAEKSIRTNIYFRGPNAWILAIATIIASVGLNVNSIPVVIGAMLISPLMGPIFGLGLGLGVNDMDLVKASGKNLLILVCISRAASFIYFLITPLSLMNPTELLARTNPTIYDVLIALFGGFAGIFEQCRKKKGTVFAGVAIATALMPPLCTAGFGLASGNFTYFLGALYLFFINCLFIMLATYFSVKYFKFRQVEFQDDKVGARTRRVSTLLIILFIIPSIWSAVVLVRQNNFEEKAISFVESSKAYGKSIIYDYKIDHSDGSSVELFFTGDPLSEDMKSFIYKSATDFGINQDQLLINDHTITESGNDIEIVKGIYDKMDMEVGKRDAEIKRLQEELELAAKDQLPYVQLTKEIVSTYPAVKQVHMAQGAAVTADSLDMRKTVIVVVTADDSFETADSSRLHQWLKVRLEADDILMCIDNR